MPGTAAAGRKTAQGVFKWNEGETPRTDRAVTQSTASDSRRADRRP